MDEINTDTLPTTTQTLLRAWRNFIAVVDSLPSSETTQLLLSHARTALASLTQSTLDIATLDTLTERVRQLVLSSPAVLDIDDMLATVEDALAQAKE